MKKSINSNVKLDGLCQGYRSFYNENRGEELLKTLKPVLKKNLVHLSNNCIVSFKSIEI